MSDPEYKTEEILIKSKLPAESENQNLAADQFLKLIQKCSLTYNYSKKAKDKEAKSERLSGLQELREFLNDPQNITNYILPNLDLVLEMIRKNIFRPLPMNSNCADNVGPSEPGEELDDNIIDPA